MSTKRQPQANEETCEALQELFLHIVEGRSELIECDDVWRQVLANAWFRAEVRLQASRLVGGDVGDPLYDDIAQDVLVKLKAKLSKHADLGADGEQLRDHFPGWLGSIIRRSCIDTLRRERRHPHAPLTESDATVNPIPQEDLRLDMAEAITHLEPREREVAQYRLGRFTIHETAEALDLSDRQVEHSLKKIAKRLRRALAVYWNDLTR